MARPKPVADGEHRVMRPSNLLSKRSRDCVRVTAYRYDGDTPIVQLSLHDFDGTELEIYMSDALAKDVADRIGRAISVLPTSK